MSVRPISDDRFAVVIKKNTSQDTESWISELISHIEARSAASHFIGLASVACQGKLRLCYADQHLDRRQQLCGLLLLAAAVSDGLRGQHLALAPVRTRTIGRPRWKWPWWEGCLRSKGELPAQAFGFFGWLRTSVSYRPDLGQSVELPDNARAAQV